MKTRILAIVVSVALVGIISTFSIAQTDISKITLFSSLSSSSVDNNPNEIYPVSAKNDSKTDDATKNKPEEKEVSEADINRFTNTIVLIKDFYVQPTGDRKLLDSAIRGMVGGLDPHSEYLDVDAYKSLLTNTSGEFGGVGIEITPEFGILKIVSPIDDTPAAKAGIKAGDFIVAINGKLVSEMTLQDAVKKLRGKPNSEVVMTILRKGEKSPLTFKLKREIIHIASIKSKMMDNNFGYVRVTQFQEPTAKLLHDAILKLKKDNNNKLNGIILDLRNNPGGLLESAVDIVNQFLDSKQLNNKYDNLIVYTEGRLPEAQYKAKADGKDILKGAPMVVLINGGSASASEIVAGALQDYNRAIIAGTSSFGKGSVQTVIPLDKTHALKLTTALYHTPSGKVIQNVGIVPDVQIDDLKIESGGSETDMAMIAPIKEYQLKNRLDGDSTSAKNLEMLSQNELALAQEDFQLFQALKILRTMDMLSKRSIVTQPILVKKITEADKVE